MPDGGEFFTGIRSASAVGRRAGEYLPCTQTAPEETGPADRVPVLGP